MRRLSVFLLIPGLLLTAFAGILSGCAAVEALQRTKVDNPVLGPPPPRVASASDGQDRSEYINDPLDDGPNDSLASSEEGGEPKASVRAINFTSGRNDTKPVDANDVVATVNGDPIFAGEVLEPVHVKLEVVRKQSERLGQPEKYRQVRRDWLKQLLPPHIENRLLVGALRATLEQEQLDRLDQAIDELYPSYVERLQQELKANSRSELEIELAKQGTSLASLKDAFAHKTMADTFLEAKIKLDRNIGRPQLLAYYEEHFDEYAIPGQVKWQQIQISFAKHGGKKPALRILEQAIAELRDGSDFTDVAIRFSDGPTASQGGDWGWMQSGSLSNKEIEQALFDLPLGTISQVFVDDEAYRLVKVNDRKPAGHVPLAEVQDEIKSKLLEQAHEDAKRNVIDELYASAVIETIFDEDQ